MPRDPAQPDRNGLPLPPRRVLGLAVGTAAAEQSDPGPRRWLQQTLDVDRDRLPAAGTWHHLLLALAKDRLGLTQQLPCLVAETQLDIALMVWLHLADEALAWAHSGLTGYEMGMAALGVPPGMLSPRGEEIPAVDMLSQEMVNRLLG